MLVAEHDNGVEDPGLLIWDLLPNLSQTRQNPRIHFDAIPQILKPQTFIFRMLIIIMIDHGHDNQRGLQNPVEDEKG